MCWECFELNQNLTVRPGDDVQAILDRAEPGAVLRFAPGEYRQKLMIRTPGLTLEGAGAEQTALVWDDWAKKLDAEGREYNTFRTWSVAVCADDVTMRGLTIINDALRGPLPHGRMHAPLHAGHALPRPAAAGSH